MSELPCGYTFPARTRCLAGPAHPIHHNRWTGREPRHEYEPFDRRKGDRRHPADKEAETSHE